MKGHPKDDCACGDCKRERRKVRAHLPPFPKYTTARRSKHAAPPKTLCGLVAPRRGQAVRLRDVTCEDCQRIAQQKPQLVNQLLAGAR